MMTYLSVSSATKASTLLTSQNSSSFSGCRSLMPNATNGIFEAPMIEALKKRTHDSD